MKKKFKFIFLIFTGVIFISFDLHAATFIPGISLSQEYDDNLYLEEDNRKNDWISVVSPGFVCEARTRKLGATIEYDFSHSTYHTHSENDSFRHNAFFDSWLKFNKYTEAGLSNSFVQTEEPVTEGDSSDIRNSREPYYSNSVSIDINHIFGENRVVNFAYTYDILENEDKAIEDNESHNGVAILNYNFDPHLGVETDISYTNGRYDISDDFARWEGRIRLSKKLSHAADVFAEYSHTDFNSRAPDHTDDYRIYNPSGGAILTFGDGGTFSINLGYFIQERNGADNEVGFTIDGNLGKQWRFRHGLIELSGTSGYEDSQLGSENLGFNVFHEAAANAEYRFTRNLRGNIGGLYRHDDYANPVEGQAERKDKNYNADATLAWQAKQWLALNLNYQYQNRNSTINQEDYVQNSVFMTVSLTYR